MGALISVSACFFIHHSACPKIDTTDVRAAFDRSDCGHDSVFVKLEFPSQTGIRDGDNEDLAGVDAQGAAAPCKAFPNNLRPVTEEAFFGGLFPDVVAFEADFDD